MWDNTHCKEMGLGVYCWATLTHWRWIKTGSMWLITGSRQNVKVKKPSCFHLKFLTSWNWRASRAKDKMLDSNNCKGLDLPVRRISATKKTLYTEEKE
jgi:hypothetical protein